jgi:polar amino acid transport system substrate-binding protein
LSQTSPALERIRSRGSLRVPVQFTGPPSEGYPPEFYIDPETGQPNGIAPIIGGMMAKDLGVKLECVDLPWPEHIPAMLDGEVDVCPKHTNTPARALLVDFAIGRLTQYRVSLLVRSDNTASTKEAFDRPEVTIASWHGSSTTQVAELQFPHAKVIESPIPRELLERGEVDAVCTDSVTKVFLEKNPTIKLLKDHSGQLVVLSREYVHPSVRPGDPRFLNWVNNFLEYHSAQGTIDYWCDTWWESFMADQG